MTPILNNLFFLPCIGILTGREGVRVPLILFSVSVFYRFPNSYFFEATSWNYSDKVSVAFFLSRFVFSYWKRTCGTLNQSPFATLWWKVFQSDCAFCFPVAVGALRTWPIHKLRNFEKLESNSNRTFMKRVCTVMKHFTIDNFDYFFQQVFSKFSSI